MATKLNEREAALAKQFAAAGMSVPEIARTLNKPGPAVWGALKFGVKREPVKLALEVDPLLFRRLQSSARHRDMSVELFTLGLISGVMARGHVTGTLAHFSEYTRAHSHDALLAENAAQAAEG